MFLKHTPTGDLIRIEDVEQLFDPSATQVRGRDQAGEEEQDSDWYDKDQLVFPSGESLPRCWIDAEYRAHAKPVRKAR